MGFKVVIPARYASTRLPGKPLLLIGNLPMIAHVANRALASRADDVVIATDDQRIVDTLSEQLGDAVEAMLTRPDHLSGSDRVMEVVQRKGWRDDEIVVNVQGDEPLIPPQVINQVAALLGDAKSADTDCGVATLCEPIDSNETLFDPNAVKVVFNVVGEALMFSRSAIPYGRQLFGDQHALTGAIEKGGLWWRHIGIYAYRVSALAEYVALPESLLERTEQLEQLRLLENGRRILVQPAIAPVPGGVDTPEDLARVIAQLT